MFLRWLFRGARGAGVLLVLGASPARAAETSWPLGRADGRWPSRVRSWTDARDRGVVRQSFDFSCGSAALATLLTHGLGDPVSEGDVIAFAVAAAGSAGGGALRAKGLSLLDLQGFTESRGHRAAAFRVDAAQLKHVARPVVVHLRTEGGGHFAVLKSVHHGAAYLADPSIGNTRMPLHRFLQLWSDERESGVIFAVEPRNGRWTDDAALQTPARPAAPASTVAARDGYRPGARTSEAIGRGQ